MTKNNAINAPLPIAETKGGTHQSTYTTGDILYASASNTLSKLPIGTAGSQLISTGTIPAWFNPDTDINVYEEFIGVPDKSFYGFTSLGTRNENGSIQDKDHPGVWGISGTSVGNDQYIAATSGTGSAMILGGGAISSRWYLKIPILSTSSQRFVIEVGFINTASGAISEGVYFSYTDNVNSGNWTINTMNASTPTSQDSTIAVGTGWTKLQIDINAAGNSASFYVNGVQTANSPIGTNLPTGGIAPCARILKTVGTGQRYIHVDYFQMFYQLTASR